MTGTTQTSAPGPPATHRTPWPHGTLVPVASQTLKTLISLGAADFMWVTFHHQPGKRHEVSVGSVTALATDVHDATRDLVQRARHAHDITQIWQRLDRPTTALALQRDGAPDRWDATVHALTIALRRPGTILLYRPGTPDPWYTHRQGDDDDHHSSYADAVNHLSR